VTDREKKETRKEKKRQEEGWGNERKKERKRDKNETVGPRVGCSPNSSTCPRDASSSRSIGKAQTQERRIFDPCQDE